jgi:tetratricopeptide (TPR) repeat protein
MCPSRQSAGQPGGISISGIIGEVKGDIISRDQIIGLDEKEIQRRVAEAQQPLAEQVAAITAQIAREKGVEVAPLRAILIKLGEAGVSDHEIPARLNAAADQLIELRTQLARLTDARPEFSLIRNQALALIDQGELDAARAALARGREAARELRENLNRNEGEFLADEARIDHLQLDYQAAAEKYAGAAALVTSFDRDAGWEYLLKQAQELYDHGSEFGENQSLLRAIDVYHSALTLVLRDRVPLQWAETQDRLGIALWGLGERENGTARLEEAIIAFGAALEESTRDRVPLQWAVTQNNLAMALSSLGERESGTTRLEEAVAAFRVVLDVPESARERDPLGWARTQNNLGLTLTMLGERENGKARLHEAVAVFRAALKEQTRDREPRGWAQVQRNLAKALLALGQREGGGTTQLQDAVAAYRAALEEQIREREPLDWAGIQVGLAGTLAVLAMRLHDVAQMQQAISCMREAIDVCNQTGEAYLRPMAEKQVVYFEDQLARMKA